MTSQVLKSLAAVVMLALSFSVAAESRPVIRIAMPENFYPFYAINADKEPVGASYEIVAALLNKLEYQIEVTQLSDMKSTLQALETGHQDLMVNLTETPSRAEIALFTSTPHLFESQDLIVRADSPLAFKGRLLDLAPYRVGVIAGWTYGANFDNAGFIQKQPVTDSIAQLKGLFAGRYDIAINNQQFFLSTARQLGVEQALKVIKPSVFELPVTIAISRQHIDAEALRDRLENALRQFVFTPQYREILTRYGFENRYAEGAL